MVPARKLRAAPRLLARRLLARRLFARRLLAGFALAAAGFAAQPAAAELAVGDVAPDFALAGSDGQTYRLSELLADGRTKVALAWFPKAFTSGCTEELRSLRDSGKALAGFDVRTFMVSLDPPERNRAFAGSLDADLTLLSDPDGAVARRYGVLAPGGGYARRWTFYIDSSGVIERIDRDVKPASAGADLLSVFETLGW